MTDSDPGGDAPSSAQDVAPTWTSSAKDLVTTALRSSRVWVTIGHGILNEVYWPSTGEPQIRDLGFIVAGPHGWSEVKRVYRYTITTPEPDLPLPTIVHEGPGGSYRLTLEIVPDSARDVVLIRYALEGDGCRLYVLLSPRLGQCSNANSAWTGRVLMAEGGGAWLCLACSRGFSRASAGYVGTSDGWQDFNRNGRMTWNWGHAGPGNVALMGEVAENSGTLALGFAHMREGAITLARSSLAVGFEMVHAVTRHGWLNWTRDVRTEPLAGLAPGLVEQAKRSAAVLKTHEDRTFPGAVVASLSVPWGNSRDDLGGYHLVWARDAVNAGLGLLTIGLVGDARRMLAYLMAMQQPDGHWTQNFFPAGRPFWNSVQLDEVGFPILLAAKLHETGLLRDSGETADAIRRMVESAAGYIIRNGPSTQEDRWEENSGFNPYTLAVIVAALIAAAEWLEGDARAYALAVADDWNARIEDWTYVTGSDLARAHQVEGHYVRIAPNAVVPVAEQSVEVHNRGGFSIRADALVALDFLALSRFGLRSASDPRMQNTVKICDAVLKVATPLGDAFHRYNEDGYGEREDGGPFDGVGVGRGWPLLAGERGHFALQAGEDARPWLTAMSRMTGPGGLIPEQVWDAQAASFGREPGKPSGSAMPLVWAHSEFLRLAVAIGTGKPVETLDCVTAHLAGASPKVEARRWRSGTPLRVLPQGGTLVVEDPMPFSLHFSWDGWHSVEDEESRPLPFGMNGVSLTIPPAATGLVFTRRFEAGWEGMNHTVAAGGGSP